MGPDILVFNGVTIKPPYKVENVSGDPDSRELTYVKKIVEKFTTDQSVAASVSGTGLAAGSSLPPSAPATSNVSANWNSLSFHSFVFFCFWFLNNEFKNYEKYGKNLSVKCKKLNINSYTNFKTTKYYNNNNKSTKLITYLNSRIKQKLQIGGDLWRRSIDISREKERRRKRKRKTY